LHHHVVTSMDVGRGLAKDLRMHADFENDSPATEDPQSPSQPARDEGALAHPSTGRTGGAGCLVRPAARPALHPKDVATKAGESR
jgi:hypothetical protein